MASSSAIKRAHTPRIIDTDPKKSTLEKMLEEEAKKIQGELIRLIQGNHKRPEDEYIPPQGKKNK